MNFTRKYLSKFLPGGRKKPKSKHSAEPAAARQTTQPSAAPPASSATQPKPPLTPPLNPLEMLDSIAKLLRKYLVCEDYQLTILALWIAHTWSFRAFPTAAYLHLCSAETQSGKTLCFKLLEALCNSPWAATGAHWRSIMKSLLTPERRIDPGKPPAPSPCTILLDDCHHTFDPSERQPVVALLNSGSLATSSYLDVTTRYTVFGPKVFAGNARLPRSLAGRCIPIKLRRKKPSDRIARLNGDASTAIARLRESLAFWAAANSPAVAKIAHQEPPRMPAGLTAREWDCAEPLAHIADLVGGPWPDRARAAFAAAFKLSDSSLALLMIADIRAIFFLKDDPPYLSSRDLVETLTTTEYRPWGGWKKGLGAAHRIADLLSPFGLGPRNMTKGSGPTFRGYDREPFLEVWERYLPPIPDDWHTYRDQMKKEAEERMARALRS